MKVVNKVSEDADFRMESATDATEQAIAWTLKLYRWVTYKFCHALGLLQVGLWDLQNHCRLRIPRDLRQTLPHCLLSTETG